VKWITAILSFLFVWLGVAVIVAYIIVRLFPPANPAMGTAWLPFWGVHFKFGLGITVQMDTGTVGAGLGLEWWNLPGTLLGLFAGLQSARASLRAKKKIESPSDQARQS
jgi:hypothetical protein